jgi:PKHD-type hydroxylase
MPIGYDVYRVMPLAQAQEIVLGLQGLDWEQGKARTAEATGTIKKNEEIKVTTSEAGKALLDRVQQAVQSHPRLLIDQMVKKQMSLKFNRYAGGGEYQRHGDAAVMGKMRTDISMTLFLSHPDTYRGGELCIEAQDGGHSSIKGDPGTAVVYPCHMPHWVNPVTEGERICAVTWFESAYRDTRMRDLQRRFLRCLKEMEADPELPKYGRYYTTLGTIQGELTRMFADYQ